MKMTVQQKLDKCMEFLEYIENIAKNRYDIYGMRNRYDSEYGMNEIQFNNEYRYMDHARLDEITERAWHLKADISD